MRSASKFSQRGRIGDERGRKKKRVFCGSRKDFLFLRPTGVWEEANRVGGSRHAARNGECPNLQGARHKEEAAEGEPCRKQLEHAADESERSQAAEKFIYKFLVPKIGPVCRNSTISRMDGRQRDSCFVFRVVNLRAGLDPGSQKGSRGWATKTWKRPSGTCTQSWQAWKKSESTGAPLFSAVLMSTSPPYWRNSASNPPIACGIVSCVRGRHPHLPVPRLRIALLRLWLGASNAVGGGYVRRRCQRVWQQQKDTRWRMRVWDACVFFAAFGAGQGQRWQSHCSDSLQAEHDHRHPGYPTLILQRGGLETDAHSRTSGIQHTVPY